jgi:hypothetical protein
MTRSTKGKSSAMKQILLVALILLFTTGFEAASQWCYPSFWYAYMGIGSFTLRDPGGNTLLSYSGNTGWGYVSSSTCSLSPNTTYTFSITGGYYMYGGQYPQSCNIWLDANNNYSFEYPSESLYYNCCTYTFNGSFQIPANGTTGLRRLRIEMDYYGYGGRNACPSTYYGSYLDFNVTCAYVQPYDIGVS